MIKSKIFYSLLFTFLFQNSMVFKSQTIHDQSVSTLEKQFTSTELPVECRPWQRYWWLGGAVTNHQRI